MSVQMDIMVLPEWVENGLKQVADVEREPSYEEDQAHSTLMW